MDSRQQFVLVFTSLSMISFTVLAFLNTTEIGIYASSFAIIYFAIRLILNPKIRISVDVLGLLLLVIFLLYVSQRIISILR